MRKGINYYENGNKQYDGDYKDGNANGKLIKFYDIGNKLYDRRL